MLVSDEDLFKKVVDGSKEAMELIVHRYYKNIFRYIYSKTNDYHLSEDLCQEVFCKVYNKRNSYSFEYSLKPWIYKIAHNCIVDYMRTQSYKNKDNIEVLDEERSGGQNVIEYQFFKNNIDDLIEGINEEQKEVIKLRFCHELSIESIANITGTNLNTAKSRLYQGMKHIKDKIKGLQGGVYGEKKIK